eukprot:1139993-Pelagomonas_calceolata.AAC.7
MQQPLWSTSQQQLWGRAHARPGVTGEGEGVVGACWAWGGSSRVPKCSKDVKCVLLYGRG